MSVPSTPERPVVLYDGDCGFCRWTVDVVLELDRRGHLRASTIQGAEGQAYLSGIRPDRRLDSVHVVGPDGNVRSAGAAIGPILRELPAGTPLAALAARAPHVTERLYRFAARNRGTLGRIVGSRACAVDPQRPRRGD